MFLRLNATGSCLELLSYVSNFFSDKIVENKATLFILKLFRPIVSFSVLSLNVWLKQSLFALYNPLVV
jgi:hypothetical protein